MPRRVLVLAPHPDDAEFFAGGTIARFAREGERVVLVIASDGRKGSFEHAAEALADVRRQEARAAAEVLGVEEVIFLGHPDLELDTLPAGLLRGEFIRLIRQHRPHAVITQDPFAVMDVHPDHRAVAWAASDAIHFAMLPLVRPEDSREGLDPHFVAEKYFYAEVGGAENKVIDISQTMDIKLAALAEHASQMTFLVEEIRRQAGLAELDVSAVLGSGSDDPMTAVAWAMRSQAAEIGKRIGVPYGEAFRFTRFHPLIESLLSANRPS
jgi:LmbE family N-acetylglucosaminyl deacetylase